MNLSPCECEAVLLWACASPCVGEHTRLWLSALVGHFMSLCVNWNEILEEWPFSRSLFFFFSTLVSKRPSSRALFLFFFFDVFWFSCWEVCAWKCVSRYCCTVLAVPSHQPDMGRAGPTLYPVQSGHVLVVCDYVDPSVKRGCIVFLMAFSLSFSPVSDEVWLFFLRVLLAIFTAIWRTIWIQSNSWNLKKRMCGNEFTSVLPMCTPVHVW